MERLARQNPQEAEMLAGIIYTAPTIGFDKSITLDFHPRIEIIHVGGHTSGSCVVYVPEEKTLFSGDVIFQGSHPFMRDANLEEWVAALQRIKEMDVSNIVPGHGNLCGKEEVDRHIEYLRHFSIKLRELKERGMKKEYIKNKISLFDFPELSGEKMVLDLNIDSQYDKV